MTASLSAATEHSTERRAASVIELGVITEKETARVGDYQSHVTGAFLVVPIFGLSFYTCAMSSMRGAAHAARRHRAAAQQ